MKIINKKKIYFVAISQTFNAFRWEKEKWYKPCKREEYIECLVDKEKLILANSEEEAVKLYKDRYEWNIADKCINLFFDLWETKINYDDPNYTCEVHAKETNCFSFNELKDKLRAEEFFEYCKQEIYPIEVVLGGE